MAKYDYQIYYDNNYRSEFQDCENRLDIDAMGKCTTCIINNKNERYLVNMAHVLFIKEVVHDETETTEQENENDFVLEYKRPNNGV